MNFDEWNTKRNQRISELTKMSRVQLLREEERVRGGRRIYGKPSRDELIHEILEVEGLTTHARWAS